MANDFGGVANFRDLFQRLCEYRGSSVWADVLEPSMGTPWFQAQRSRLSRMAAFQQTVRFATGNAELFDDLCNLYALSRVRDLLLLGFQPAQDESLPRLSPEFDSTTLNLETFAAFFEALGGVVLVEDSFQPFFHEIVVVEPSTIAPDIAITQHLWPAVLLGHLLLSRGGVVVQAQPDRAQVGVADRSTLYFEYVRRHRPTADLSHGWGSNSQWRTFFRRDYVTDSQFVFNFDGTLAPGEPQPGPPIENTLSPAQEVDLLMHRCFLIDEQHDAWPFDLTLTVPA